MSEPVNLAFAFSLTPQAALDYFRAKGYQVNPDGWAAVEAAMNRKAFTVARVASLDLLQDIKSSMDKAMASGTTFAQFQRELMPKMKALGWWGKDDNGVQLGSPHRLSTIFRTNVQTSYMEGRWQGLMENVDNRPWIEYVAILDSRTRPGHRALNAKVFRYDDIFWRTHRPPLGWNCRCRIRALNDRDLEERNITPSTGDGNISHYQPEAQGYRQPQAGYHDPATATEVKTDVGWGYDRLEGWTPDPGRYDPALRPVLDEVIQDSKDLFKIQPMPQNDPTSIIGERANAMLTALVARAVEAGPNSADGLLESLWISQERYRAHVAKRLGNDDIRDETDYALKTFKVIASAAQMKVVVANNDYASGKLQAKSDGWIVLIGNDGHIITSHPYDPEKMTFEVGHTLAGHPYDPEKMTFEVRHTLAGDQVHDHIISREIRKILESLFARY